MTTEPLAAEALVQWNDFVSAQWRELERVSDHIVVIDGLRVQHRRGKNQ